MPRVITFHYTLTDDSGEVLDTSRDGEPLDFLEGASQIIPGLERELLGLKPGDVREIVVTAADAYGDVNPDLVARVKRTQFPATAQLEVGQNFTVDASEDALVFRIVELDAEHVTVDGNHPMAGRDLTFDVEIVSMREATADERAHGHSHGPDGHTHH